MAAARRVLVHLVHPPSRGDFDNAAVSGAAYRRHKTVQPDIVKDLHVIAPRTTPRQRLFPPTWQHPLQCRLVRTSVAPLPSHRCLRQRAGQFQCRWDGTGARA